MNMDGEAWFVGKDVAEVLGYANPQKAIRDHVDDEDKLTERIVLSGQHREAVLINESGLYALILSSKLPQAKEFKHWVTAEVLLSPSCYTMTQVAKSLSMTVLELTKRLMDQRIIYRSASGCILVGANTLKAHVMDSRKYLGVITSAIRDAEDRGEVVMVSVR